MARPELVYVVLPAYNEEENITHLLEEISRCLANYRVIVVNDGSQDRTGSLARSYSERMPITVLDHEDNQGLGGALRTGILHIIQHGSPNSAIVTMDSDLTHDPASVPELLNELDNGFDVVVGSRYTPGGRQLNIPISRRILSWGINILFRLRGSSVKDNTSGFRCFRFDALRKAVARFGDDFICTNEFASTALILLRLQRIGARMMEYPIVLDYSRKCGRSKMHLLRTVLSYLSVLRSA
ncbi:MAG: glycosyltransferase family 2 protein [Candidatus Thorarchaeota archaeon]